MSRANECQRHQSEERLKDSLRYVKQTKRKFYQLHCERLDILRQLQSAGFPSDHPVSAIASQAIDGEETTSSSAGRLSTTKTVLMVSGLVKAGKTRFLNEFFRGAIHLPSEEIPCTGRFVRLKYKEQASMTLREVEDGRKVRTCSGFDGRAPPAEEIFIANKDRENKSELRRLVELGIPSPLLRCDLEIVDSPGMGENQVLTDLFGELAPRIKPDLLIYMFDHRVTFSVTDCRVLDKLAKVAGESDCSFLFVANKIDVNREADQRDDVGAGDEEEDEEDYDEDDETDKTDNTECHFFDLPQTLESIRTKFPSVEPEDVFKISATKLNDHRYEKIIVQPFLQYQLELEYGIARALRRDVLKKARKMAAEAERHTYRLLDAMDDSLAAYFNVQVESSDYMVAVQTENFPRQLDAIHDTMLRQLEAALRAKWNLTAYEADIRQLSSENIRRLSSETLDSITGKWEILPVTDPYYDLIEEITTFVTDRYANMVNYCLQVCRRDLELDREIDQLDQRLHSRKIWLTPWSGILKSAKELGRFPGSRLTSVCAECFQARKRTYLDIKGSSCLPSLHTTLCADYLYFLRDTEIITAVLDHFHELAQAEKSQLRLGIRQRCDQVTSEVTANEDTVRRVNTLIGQLTHNLLRMSSHCSQVTDEEETVASADAPGAAEEGLKEVPSGCQLSNGFSLISHTMWEISGKAAMDYYARDLVRNEMLMLTRAAAAPPHFIRPEIRFSLARDSLYIRMDRPRPHSTLIGQLGDLNEADRIGHLSSIIEQYFYLNADKRRTAQLDNFRPDIFELDRHHHRIWCNLNCPCNPLLPLMLADGKLAPPFHVHPDLVKTYPHVTLAHRLYALGWLAWIVVEGSGRKVPTFFQSTNCNSADDVAGLLLGKTGDRDSTSSTGSSRQREEMTQSALADLDWGTLSPTVIGQLRHLMTRCWQDSSKIQPLIFLYSFVDFNL